MQYLLKTLLFRLIVKPLALRICRRPANWIDLHDRPLQPKYQPTFKQRNL